jgi:Domain of unknown function (DUF4115)
MRFSARSGHPPLPRGAVVALAAVLVIVGTAGGIALSRHHGSAHVSVPPRADVPAHRAAARSSGPATTTPAPAPTPTPILVTSASGYSEYRISGPATISISAVGTCWVEIRQAGPSGQVLFEGDLDAGDTHAAAGSIWIRLGNPSQVTVSVNGAVISPPSLVAGEPYNLEFE